MKKKNSFNFTKIFLLFAVVPVLCAVIVLSVMLIGTCSKDIVTVSNNSMLSLVEDTGVGVDNYFAEGEQTLQSFVTAPIVKAYLKNPDDAELAKQAQQYTEDFFGTLEGWEGIYIADWNSKVLTHPAAPVVGKVMREGDSLKELQDAMLEAGDGVYNVGIISSPASGELIVSMYLPVYDGKKPIGYVGAGTLIGNTAARYTDVSGLGFESAYTYFVDKDGIVIAHPNEEKIGIPVENEVVKGLIEQMQSGKHPEPACVQYEYKGATKYEAYFVGVNEKYIAVLTADADDVLSNVKSIRNKGILASIVVLVIFIFVALYVGQIVMNPLSAIVKALKDTANGDLSANTNIHSIVFETQEIIASAKTLQEVLQNIIGQTKDISDRLTGGAENVTALSDQGLDSSTQIANAMEELADGATSMAKSVQDVNEKLVEIGNAIDNITANTEELETSSNNIKSANEEATNYINKVSDSSDKSVQAVHDINKQIMETNEAVDRIKEASDMISGIASQTNLLALNASIEAARAGEAGKGFAVVATEIKNLSEQSNQSVEEIKNLINEIVDKSENSVRLSSEVAVLITKEKEYIRETQNKFEMLNQEISTSLREIASISDKVETLNESKDIILNEVAALGSISEENAASNEEVSASVHEITSAVENIATNASDTKQDANQLKETIDYFS